MVTDAMLAADPVFKISSAIDDVQEYLKLTDHILKMIEIASPKVRLLSSLCFFFLRSARNRRMKIVP
jgi:hypothetical protein